MSHPIRPYEWGRQADALAKANLKLLGWLLRGAPGPWWRRPPR